MRLGWPELAAVQAADPKRMAFTIMRWNRFLPRPTTDEQREIKRLVAEKVEQVPKKHREAIANGVGWD